MQRDVFPAGYLHITERGLPQRARLRLAPVGDLPPFAAFRDASRHALGACVSIAMMPEPEFVAERCTTLNAPGSRPAASVT